MYVAVLPCSFTGTTEEAVHLVRMDEVQEEESSLDQTQMKKMGH